MTINKNIAEVKIGERTNRGQPKVSFGIHYAGLTALSVCDNGYQSTVTTITVEAFDALQKLMTNPDVLEHFESMRRDKCSK